MFVTMATDSATKPRLPGPGVPMEVHVVSIWASWCFSVSVSLAWVSLPFCLCLSSACLWAFLFFFSQEITACASLHAVGETALPQLLLASVAEGVPEGMETRKVQELGLGLGKGSARLWAL